MKSKNNMENHKNYQDQEPERDFENLKIWWSEWRLHATLKKKTGSKNSCKNLSAIQRSNQKLWLFWAIILVWHDQISSWT
jgi:hypothetical protein